MTPGQGQPLQVGPYGSWGSAFSVDDVVSASSRLGEVRISDGSVWWSAGRPLEGGRVVVVACPLRGGPPVDVLAAPWSARTSAHEYGGGAWWLDGGTLFFAEASDQRLYRLDPGGQPRAITPEPPAERSVRYADGVVTPDGVWVVCVRETHHPPTGSGAPDAEPTNELVAVAADGSGPTSVLVTGPDFVSSPAIDPDGTRLAWLQWDHPDMPWDGTALVVADLNVVEGLLTTGPAQLVAGNRHESVFQPTWSEEGELTFVSDRTGWWNLYRSDRQAHDAHEALAPMEAEVGVPQWVFGMSRYARMADGSVVCAFRSDGRDRLGVVVPGSRSVVALDIDVTSVGSIAGHGDVVAFVGATPTTMPAVRQFRLDGLQAADQQVVHEPAGPPPDLATISVPTVVTVPTARGMSARAFVYPPTNPGWCGPPGELPPLLVRVHGGPTGAAAAELYPPIQFWTSRGFVVADVDHRGSTGYGRAYRQLLDGHWGVVDVEDCVATARHLVALGMVDPARLAIRGGSAGGFTTLAALAFHDTFTAGCSLYGVADLEALALDTHKFESSYHHRLVAPYPEHRHVYEERSPIHHVEGIDAPVLLLQGADDRVVPVEQSESIAAELQRRGVPHALIVFDGEGHGFRRSDTLRAALEAELAFYANVFRFEPAGGVVPLELRRPT